MSMFASHGFAGTSIDAVAGAAGFTKGAVYSNFGSKDDLFFALMDQQIQLRAQRAVEVVRDLPAGAPIAFAAIGARLTRSMADNRDWQLLFVEYWARALRDPEVQARFVSHRRAVRRLIGAAIDDLSASMGVQLAVPTEQIALLVLGLSNGLALEELIDPGTVAESLIGTVLSGLVRQ